MQTEQQSDKFRRIIVMTNPEKRLRELAKLLGPINQCPVEQEKARKGCGCIIPTKIAVRQHRIIIEEKFEKNKIREYSYNAQKVHSIFVKITEEDANLLGFTRSKPVDLLISTLAVAPPQIRPSIEMNPEKKAEDDITITYARIVALNNELKNCV
jgi:DNA-directed RNA polymerase II subunit RPB1